MDKFILRIQRKNGLLGLATSVEVTIDGANKRKFKCGDMQEYRLDSRPVTVHLFYGVPIGKNMEHTMVVDPQGSSEVTLTFGYKINPKYYLPFGAFRYPQFLFETDVIRGGSMGNAVQQPLYQQAVNPQRTNTQQQASAQQQAFQQQQASAQQGQTGVKDYKFCPECGTRVKREAKFCSECGQKLNA